MLATVSTFSSYDPPKTPSPRLLGVKSSKQIYGSYVGIPNALLHEVEAAKRMTRAWSVRSCLLLAFTLATEAEYLLDAETKRLRRAAQVEAMLARVEPQPEKVSTMDYMFR